MLHRFLEGVQSHDNDVLTAITVSAYDVSSPVLRILMDTPVKGFECCHSHGTNAVRMIQVVAPKSCGAYPCNRKYPFNIRSFFTNQEKKEIGLGIELWRGYFQ